MCSSGRKLHPVPLWGLLIMGKGHSKPKETKKSDGITISKSSRNSTSSSEAPTITVSKPISDIPDKPVNSGNLSPKITTVKIAFSRLNISKKRLGKGGTGVVFGGLLDGKKKVAIKKLDVSTNEQHDGIMSEAKMMAKLDHKFVVGMYGVASLDYNEALRSTRSKSVNGPELNQLANHNRGESLSVPSKAKKSMYIVMELCDGSLEQLLNHPEAEADFDTHALSIALQVAETMAFLHAKQVSHRDLKPGNILLCGGDVRLCDFGLSKKVSEKNRNTLEIGTPTYMPPELFVDPTLDPDDPDNQIGSADIDPCKSDVYAFGIILWALFNRKHPYGKLSTFRIIYKVKLEGMRPEIEETTSPDVVKLFQDCWHEDQKSRPDFNYIFKALSDIKRKGSWFKRF